jgi:hypothetical protein
MYTKKHFIEIAKMLKNLKESGKIEIFEAQKAYFLNEFKASNPRFDVSRFLKACGVNS